MPPDWVIRTCGETIFYKYKCQSRVAAPLTLPLTRSASMNIYIQHIQSIAFPNKYTKWYLSIVQNSRYINGYGENHHILPKCFKLGGEKNTDNIVKLTAREHYICHLLLTKMFEGKKRFQMNYALLRMMVKQTDKQQRNYSINSSLYSFARQHHSTMLKSNNPNKDGKFAKEAWSKNPERKKLQSNLLKTLNTIHKSKPKISREYICVMCDKVFVKQEFSHKLPSNQKCCSRSCNAKLATKVKWSVDCVTRTTDRTPR